MANLVDDSKETLLKCAQLLKEGKLIAFPTETVYGLGGDLFNKRSIEKIYAAKKRPKTDPLIVHLSDKKNIENLINLNEFQQKCFDILTAKYWPGPLTLVMPASANVPITVMGGGNFIGIRVPSHPIAKKFLSFCENPVVAPSANLFGHVSPTAAKHVFDDLGNVDDIFIIDTQNKCEVGIESTVLKLEYENAITVLRLGGIPANEIKSEILNHNIFFKFSVKKNYNEQLEEKNVSRETFSKIQNVSRETFLKESPGQNLTHYSPWIPTYIFDKEKKLCKKFVLENGTLQRKKVSLQTSVFIDFKKSHSYLEDKVLKYYDLSQKGNLKEATFSLYRILREAEKIPNAQQILIGNIPLDTLGHEALFDRVFRSASGNLAY